VQRAGLDLGAETYYGPAYFRNNVLENPGFEPVESGRVIDAQLASSTIFCDTVNYYEFTKNFYNGATFEDVYSSDSSNVGKTGTITAYDPTGAGCSNGNPKWTYSASFTIKTDDIVVVHASGNVPSPAGGCTYSPACGPAEMWWFQKDAQWTTSTDQSPGGDGVQSLQLNLDGSTHHFDFYFDGAFTRNYFLINGNWTFSIWSKAVSGVSPSCTVTLSREGAKTFFSNTWTPGSSWAQHVVAFTGADSAAPVAANDLNIQCSGSGSGAAIRLDDAYLGPASTTDVWRSALIAALQQIHPGYLRDNQGAQGDSYANAFSDAEARQQTTDGSWGGNQYIYSIPEFFDLNSKVGSRPWVVIPVNLLDSEYTALGNQLALLQSTYKFPEVLLEFGNEDWNGASCGGVCFDQGGNVNQGAYATVANRVFAIIAAAAGSSANLKFVGGAQWGSPPGPADVQYISGLIPNANYIDAAPYWDWCQDSGYSTGTNETNMWNDSQQDTSEVTMASTVSSLIPVSQKLAFYEMGPSTLGGSATATERSSIIAGAGSAGAEAQTILRALTAGVPVMNSWQLIQPNMNTANDYFACSPGDNPPSGTTAAIWGVVNFIDTPVLRPRALALQLLNNYAIGGDFYPVTGAPSGITAGAFLQSDGWHLGLTNSNAAAANIAVTFPNSTHPLPTTAQQVIFTNVTDHNEGATPAVTLGAGPAITKNSAVQVTVVIPAYGAVAAKP
jgi:hypothetical protein